MSVQVIAPGLLTTVQDLGRVGWRHLGVAQCGALDPGAAALANRMVGNAADAALLELSLQGPTLRFEHPTRLAVCGSMVIAQFEEAQAEGRCTVHGGRPVELPAGILRVGALHGGARAWMAFAGGIDVPRVLGSRSTDLRGGFGGVDGRALRSGDRLRLLDAPRSAGERPRMPGWWIDPDFEDRSLPIRYVPPELPSALGLAQRRWQASAHSDRQGLRLEGTALEHPRTEEISAGVAPGTVQLPPDGQPIVLLSDAQTIGGYPRLGRVIGADLPRLAQVRPGDTLRFEPCDRQTATRLACAARARIARISLMIDHQLARGNLG